jgi:nucleoside phosphorylase
MSLVHVFAASKMEGQPVERIAASPPNEGRRISLRAGANDFVLINSGMGPNGPRAKATAALDRAFGREADAVFIIGLCGCLSRSLPENRIVAVKLVSLLS